jgi:hypothetical protein
MPGAQPGQRQRPPAETAHQVGEFMRGAGERRRTAAGQRADRPRAGLQAAGEELGARVECDVNQAVEFDQQVGFVEDHGDHAQHR